MNAATPMVECQGLVHIYKTGELEVVALQGLDPPRMYRLTDVRTRAVLGSYSGAQLEAGVSFTLPPYTAQVLAVAPAG